MNCVRLRKNFKTKTFKGSVFVEFATDVEAKAVAQKQLTFVDQALTLKLKYVVSQFKFYNLQGRL